MAIEDEVAAVLTADATLMAVLTGGVYTSGTVGPLGITRETTPAAFDAGGWLRPAALVRQRGQIPDGNVRDGVAQVTSTTQVVEVWLYEDQGSTSAIDAAAARIYALLEGTVVGDAFPLELVNLLDRERDEGALSESSLARMDFVVYSIMGIGV